MSVPPALLVTPPCLQPWPCVNQDLFQAFNNAHAKTDWLCAWRMGSHYKKGSRPAAVSTWTYWSSVGANFFFIPNVFHVVSCYWSHSMCPNWNQYLPFSHWPSFHGRSSHQGHWCWRRGGCCILWVWPWEKVLGASDFHLRPGYNVKPHQIPSQTWWVLMRYPCVWRLLAALVELQAGDFQSLHLI